MFAILLWLLSLALGGVLLYWIITVAINHSDVAAIQHELSYMKSKHSQQHTELIHEIREMQLLMKEQNEILREIANKKNS